MELGPKIKALRNERGLSQTQLSFLAKVPQSTIARYERGERQPQIHQISKIASAFGISISALLCKEIIGSDSFAAANDTIAELRIRLEKIEDDLRQIKKMLEHVTQGE